MDDNQIRMRAAELAASMGLTVGETMKMAEWFSLFLSGMAVMDAKRDTTVSMPPEIYDELTKIIQG